jgi:hypothetical protein
MNEEKQTRSHQVTIRLEPKIYDALIEISDRVGIKPASVAGLAIGDYVTKAQVSYNSATVMQKFVAEELVNHIRPFLTEDLIKGLIQSGAELNNDD